MAGYDRAIPGPNVDPTIVNGVLIGYRLSSQAKNNLRPFFQRWNLNPDDITIDFGQTFGAQAYTFANFIEVNPEDWNGMTPKEQRELIAHEMTHSVQYQILGRALFLKRYFIDQPIKYGVPYSLQIQSLSTMNVIDPAYTLDQLADRVELEYHKLGQ